MSQASLLEPGLALCSLGIFLKLHSYGSRPTHASLARSHLCRAHMDASSGPTQLDTGLEMVRLHLFMFLVLNSKWKISKTIPPNATAIAGNNVIV